MQQKLLRLADQRTINQLLVQLRAQSKRRQGLRFTPCKDGTAMAPRQVVNLSPNGANLIRLAPVKANVLVEQQIAHRFFLSGTDVLSKHERLLLDRLFTQPLHEGILDCPKRCFALFLGCARHCCLIKLGIQLRHDLIPEFFVMRLMRVIAGDAEMSGLLRQCNLGFTLPLDRLVCHLNRVNHLILTHLMHLPLHHDNGIHRSGHHHLNIGRLHLCAGRVHNKLTADSGHTDFRNRSIKWDIGNGNASRSGQSRQAVRQNFRIRRHQLNHDLGASVVVRWEGRTQSTIHQAHHQHFGIGWACLSLEESPWEPPRCGVLLSIIYRQRKKIDIIPHLVCGDNCGQ